MQAVVSFPSSEAEWRQALAAVHPDRTGLPGPFRDAVIARDVWRKTRPRMCLHCGRVLRYPRPGKTHCNRYCANQTVALGRRKMRVIKGMSRRVPIPLVTVAQVPGPPVILPAMVYHARHEAVFGPFGRCKHTVCFRARHPERRSA